MTYVKNQTIIEQILVSDNSGDPVTGLVNNDFNKTLLKNKLSTTETLIVSEKGNGFYYIEFTPESSGFYEWFISNNTYNTKGWWEYYNIVDYSLDDIKTDTDSIIFSLSEQEEYLKRLLGLSQENYYLDNTIFNANGNLISARIRIYDNSSDVGTNNNILATYNITSEYSSEGTLTNYSVVKQ